MDEIESTVARMSRRQALKTAVGGLGSMALGSLLAKESSEAVTVGTGTESSSAIEKPPETQPKVPLASQPATATGTNPETTSNSENPVESKAPKNPEGDRCH